MDKLAFIFLLFIGEDCLFVFGWNDWDGIDQDVFRLDIANRME
jgi:hypothetical protein